MKEMEDKQILDGNKLLADFMGIKIGVSLYSYRIGVQNPIREQDLNFHASWGWLMGVVEKIESIHDDFHGYFGVYISGNTCTIQGTKLDTSPETFHPAYLSDVNAVFPTKIESTWYNVVQFIKWYNETIKK